MIAHRGVELYCRRCGGRRFEPRPAPDLVCECGAGLYRRDGEPPRPSTHWLQIARSFVTLRGVFFFATVAVLGALPIGLAQRIAAVLVYLAAIKMAMRAMKVTRNEPIQFPEVSADELFDFGTLIPAAVFVVVFTWAPPILLAFGASGALDFTPETRDTREAPAFVAPDDLPDAARFGADVEDLRGLGVDTRFAADEAADLPPIPDELEDGGGSPWSLVAIIVGLLLLAWAPMALVLYLRTGTTFGFFHVPGGIGALRADPVGYLALAALVLPTMGVRFVADLMQAALPFVLAPPIVAGKAAAIILGWGIAGLYVRQHARSYDMPVDEDDWVLFTRFPQEAPVPVASARPTAIDLDEPPLVRGAALDSGDDLPVIAGKLVP
ncbi:MAG: hypothetical protein IT383_06310 [Deltaproteobacteria bacterium]|nr:hypothetical protein [Deltaproteobacteria bacterium]